MVLCSGDDDNEKNGGRNEKDGFGKGDDDKNEKDGSGNANGIGNNGMGMEVRAMGLYYSHIRVNNHIE
jgi:hypothetical protein